MKQLFVAPFNSNIEQIRMVLQRRFGLLLGRFHVRLPAKLIEMFHDVHRLLQLIPYLTQNLIKAK